MTDCERKGITDLPFESYSHICKYISIRDVLNLSVTCKRLNEWTNNKWIWKCKFIQRWPSLKKTYTEYLGEDDIDMKEELKKGIDCEKVLLSCLSLMPYTDATPLQPRYHTCEMKEFDSLFYYKEDTYLLRYYYFHNKLTEIMKCDPRNMETNLTHMHYADMLLKYIMKCYIKNKWQTLMNVEPQQKVLEKAALIVSQWHQPSKYLFHSHIAELLNSIVNRVLEILRDQHPRHSIFTMSKEDYSFLKSNNISDHRWDQLEARQILDVLCRVIFHELQFHADLEQENTEPEVFFIDQVLEKEKGSSVCLAVIIEAIARRLGVHCEIMALNAHLSLRWIDNYKIDFKDENCYFIDIHNDGSILKSTEYHNYDSKGSVLTIVQVALWIHRSLGNMYLNDNEYLLSEFSKILNISDDNTSGSSSDEIDVDINPEIDIISTMNNLKENIESMCQSPYVSTRRNNPKYMVGMLVRYTECSFGNEGVGVIIGWDYGTNVHCEPPRRKATPPFYYILGCDNIEIYVAEQYVKPMDTSYWINHSNIGQFFSHFHGTHYVSNQVHQRYFPDDAMLLEEYINRRSNVLEEIRNNGTNDNEI